jgi:uncharacterized protein
VSRALLDVNVLIALLDPNHIQHELTQDWFSDRMDDGWASCPITENGFVRIVAQPNYPNPVAIADAVSTLATLMRETDHAFWADSVSLVDGNRFDPERLLSPRQITDSYLLALAAANSGTLATLDRRLITDATPAAKDHLLVIG